MEGASPILEHEHLSGKEICFAIYMFITIRFLYRELSECLHLSITSWSINQSASITLHEL